jgi:Ferritin-like domain
VNIYIFQTSDLPVTTVRPTVTRGKHKSRKVGIRMADSHPVDVAEAAADKRSVSRRSFFKQASIAGGSVVALSGLLSLASAQTSEENKSSTNAGITTGDQKILIAAEIAEALAVTTYTHIIAQAPFFANLPKDDQGYLRAARQEEMSHYLLEESVTSEPTPFTSFFYPPRMFEDAQTTLNVLVTLEDAFIAAYLVGVRRFSSDDFKVTAARIMGIESDHRTLARVLAGDVSPADGGPIHRITGIQGVSEPADPPNNNGYERTLCWNQISQVVTALTPFVNVAAAQAAGFDTTKSFKFSPFTPHLPFKLGDFVSFTGC